MSRPPSALSESTLAEVWGWDLSEVLYALRYPADHVLTAAEVERMAAMRGLGFAAGLLIERAHDGQGWQPAAKALIGAARAALSGIEAPPMALAFLDSAQKHLGDSGVKWEAIELYARAAHDEQSPPLIGAAARVALAATHLAGEPAPGDVAREALEALFVALPKDKRLPLLCRGLSHLEKALRGLWVAPSDLEKLAWRGGAIHREASLLGAPRALCEARTWGPAEVLRALRIELSDSPGWTAADLDRWAALEGADFAAGLVLGRVEAEHGEREAAGLLREARAFVFRELGVALGQQEGERAPTVATSVAQLGGERAGRTFARDLAEEEGGAGLMLPVLAFLEAREAALFGNGGAGAPLGV